MAKRQQKRARAAARAREAQRRQDAARQNKIIMVVGGILALLVVGFLIWQLLGRSDANAGGLAASDCPGTPLTGERPLAALNPPARDAYYDSYPDMVIEDGKQYYASLQTEKGEICLQLFTEEAPLAANNFVFLATQGFYDGTTFHRVLPNFMAQGGDPTGTGGGGPGYQFDNEVAEGLTFDRRGLLAMANSGPDTNGSQFFITFLPTPHLNGGYTIFGELVSGDTVLGEISFRNPETLQPGAGPGDRLERVDIHVVE